MTRHLIIASILLLSSTASFADSLARSIGNAFGEFGAGVGEVVGGGLANTLSSQQTQWITINPKSKEECFAEAGQVINAVYMRCRNGRQEFVRFDAKGTKIVLNERPIPLH